MIIQLATVSFSSDPEEYWDGVQKETIEINGLEKDIYTKQFDSIEQCWKECDRHDIIVSETNVYKKELTPDKIDFCVKAYDGYNE